jgi:hypothetical protein
VKLKTRGSKLISGKKLTVGVVQVDAHPQRELSQLPLHPLLSPLLELSLQQQLFFSVLEQETSVPQHFFELLTPHAIALLGIKSIPINKTTIM